MKPYYESQIEKAFHFTELDLRENRNGKLSAAQAARLRSNATRILVVVGGGLAAVTLLGLLSAQASASEITLVLLCLVLPTIAFTFAFTLGTTEAAIGPRVVSKVSGQAHFSYGLGAYDPPLDAGQKIVAPAFIIGRQAAYRIIVGEREFRLGKEEYEALTPGYYTVYFVPTINKIVSIQRIDPDERIGVSEAPKEIIITPGLPLDDSGEDVRA